MARQTRSWISNAASIKQSIGCGRRWETTLIIPGSSRPCLIGATGSWRRWRPPRTRPSSPPPPETPAGRTAVPLIRRPGFLAVAGVLLAVAIIALAYRTLLSSAPRIQSIAVLPLENLSGNPAQEYFSDGLTDELIGEVARIRSLRVISRTSSCLTRGRPQIAAGDCARTNVDAILEGTVVQSGQRVRMTAQLIRARDDRHIYVGKVRARSDRHTSRCRAKWPAPSPARYRSS